MLRGLIADFKEYPATLTLGALWVIVFLLMVCTQIATGPIPSFQQFLIGNVGSAHRFGDMTVAELLRGEIWRTVTCTFVHYNLLHVGMNLYGLYQLGCLVEMWYGPWQFVGLYVLIGGGGNLVSGLIRAQIGGNPLIHSGGGSTVVLGLVALCAVVGWRSKTRIGDYLRSQMVGILLFTAFLGQMTSIIDNWGHAGGAMVGAAVGFAHRSLVRSAARPLARWLGVIGALVIVASGAAQIRENRTEEAFRRRIEAARSRFRVAHQIERSLSQVGDFYRQAALRSEFEHARFVPAVFLRPPTPQRSGRNPAPPTIFDVSTEEFRSAQKRFLEVLDQAEESLTANPAPEEFRQVRKRLEEVLKRPPAPGVVRDFEGRLSSLIRLAQKNVAVAQARYEALAKQAKQG